jgi:prepilin-type N-terminal cleavage/methylation domain-containing protein
MRKGFTLIEIVVSAALISIVIIAISALNLINIKTSIISYEKDEAFNIARGVCEMFKCEGEVMPQKNVVAYINHLGDIQNNVSYIVNTEPEIVNKDFEQIKSNNLGKDRFALLIETSVQQGFNILKVTVISMNEFYNAVSLLVIKPVEIME